MRGACATRYVVWGSALFDAHDHVGGLHDGKRGSALGQAELVDGVVGDGALDRAAVGELQGHVAVHGAFGDGGNGAFELVGGQKSSLRVLWRAARPDVCIGSERVFHQVEGVDFLPLQTEWLYVAFVEDERSKPFADAAVRLIGSRAFKDEAARIVGYATERVGETVYKR